MQNFTVLIARLGLSLIFILSAISQITAYGATEKVMVAQGLPPGLLPLMVFVELAGGLAIVCGFATRWAAVVLFVYSILTAMLFHGHLADQEQWLDFMKNLAIAGGFLVLAVHGPGDLSLDAWRRRRRQRRKKIFT